MADHLLVNQPLEIEQASQESIAFKMLEKIASFELAYNFPKDRKYWLRLYQQCLQTVKGHDPETQAKAD